MLWRSFPHSASTRTPQPNKRQSVGAGRVGAIRRDQARSRGKAVLGSPFGPRGRPLHALQPLRTLVHPLFIRFGGSAEEANTPNEECLFEHQNGASRPRERRDDFSRFQAWLKPCLGSLEQGTGLECLWTLWRARIQRPNRFEQIEHRTANRSRVGHEIQNARLVGFAAANLPTAGCNFRCQGGHVGMCGWARRLEDGRGDGGGDDRSQMTGPPPPPPVWSSDDLMFFPSAAALGYSFRGGDGS